MFTVNKKKLLLLICCSMSLESIASDYGPEKKGTKKIVSKVEKTDTSTSLKPAGSKDVVADIPGLSSMKKDHLEMEIEIRNEEINNITRSKLVDKENVERYNHLKAEILKLKAQLNVVNDREADEQRSSSKAKKAADQSAVSDAAQSADLDESEEQVVVQALELLQIDAKQLLLNKQNKAATVIQKAFKKRFAEVKSKKQKEALKAASDVLSAYTRSDSDLSSVIDEHSSAIAEAQSSDFLQTQISIAEQLLNQGIDQVTFESLANLSPGVQVTPGLMGSVQVCMWNVMKKQGSGNAL